VNTLPQSSNITILHDSQEWSTDLEGDIREIKIDGRRLNDVHDLAIKIDKMTSVIKALALTATFLAVIAVAGMSAIGSWLATNHEQIANHKPTEHRFSKKIEQLHSSNAIMGQKLKSLGWQWEDGDWRQIADTDLNPSK
jgi:hypothetical protein